MRSIVLGFLILVLLPRTCSAQACSNNSARQAAAEVGKVRTQLLAVKIGDSGMDETVTPATQALIRAVKDALAKAIGEYLRCAQGPVIDIKSLESAVADLLGANKAQPATQLDPGKLPETIDQVYGDDLRISISRPPNAPQLLAVKMSFDVDCGMDAMLLIYSWRNGAWQQDLRWQSGDYDLVSGAFGDFFEYAVIPRGASGSWLLAVAHGHPWCTSRWSGFDLDVLSPKQQGLPPQVLFHREASYVRETAPVMKPTADGFDLRLEIGTVETDVMTRHGIYRYSVAGDSVQRVQPIAMNGRDFVDEWAQMDWSDAARVSAPNGVGGLREIHALFDYRRDPKSKDRPSITYGAVRGCSGDSKRFQVEFSMDPGGEIYFQIEQGENSFEMLSASSKPNPGCLTADIMPRH